MTTTRRCRFACVLLALGLALPVTVRAQATTAVYDVSTLKPHTPGDNNTSWYGEPDGLRVTNVSVRELIAAAWDLRPDQITGGPDWVREQRWDFTAKSTEMTSAELRKLPAGEKRRMLQAVLTERLGLKARPDSRIATIYSLIPAKGGIKLQPILLTPEQKTGPDRPQSSIGVGASDEFRKISGHGAAMPMILRNLSNNTGKTILDKTGLPPDAVYNFELRFAPDSAPPSNAADAPPPLPTALEEQLGLHLEAARGPEPVLVIDSIQKPTEN